MGGEARNEVAAQDDVGATASSTNSPSARTSSPVSGTAGGVAPPAPPATLSDDDLEIPEFLRRTDKGCMARFKEDA